MKNPLSLLVLICLLISLISIQQPAHARQMECAWQLSGDTENITVMPGTQGASAWREGSQITTRYTHAGNEGCASPTLVTTHTWSQLPARLLPGESVNLEVGVSWELEGPPACTSLSTGLQTYIMAGTDVIRAGKSGLILSREPQGSAANSGSWTAPAGKGEGDAMSITAFADASAAGGRVTYQYRYTCQAPAATEGATATPTVTLTPRPEFICPCPPEQGGDSGARFSDFSGEVTVAHCTDLKDLQLAEMEMVLERGLHINTESESMAIISFADMTTFAMKPFTRVILDCSPPKETKLELLAGKLWVNVKKMIKDGTMNVTLNQAVAGTKGTVFVLEEDGQVSTVKVLQGSVSFTSRATGQSMLVNTGEMVSASAVGLTAAVPFDIGQELGSWPEALILEISGAPLPARSSPSEAPKPAWWVWALLACLTGMILLGLAGLGAFVLVRLLRR